MSKGILQLINYSLSVTLAYLISKQQIRQDGDRTGLNQESHLFKLKRYSYTEE